MKKIPSLRQKNGRISDGWRYTLYGVGLAVFIIGFLVISKFFQFAAMMSAGEGMLMPAVIVNSYEVQEQQWQSLLSSVGTVKAVQGTVIRAESEGIIRSIKFTPGAFVNAGEELLRQDTDIEQTQLRAAEAQVEGARLTYKRAKNLIAKGSVSRSDYNNADVALKQAEAQVASIRAIIAKKVVRAPFSGKLGIRSISVGEYLRVGDSIVQLYALNPLFVEFSLPQQHIGELSEGLAISVSADAYPAQVFTGKVTAFNPGIDLATRNIGVQATLDNTDGHLRPGMFVSVEMVLEKSAQVVFIPITAVAYSPVGNSVFVLQPGEADVDGNKSTVIQQQLVTLGAKQGDFVMVNKGLVAGQQIVSAGVFKLRPGMQVKVDNTLAPDFKLTPTPDNT